MKAKEIVASIKQKVSTGEDSHKVLTDELVADVHRMRSQNEDRKGQAAALLRLLREYNQKWNSVISQINQLPEFQKEGQSYLKADDFVTMVLSSIRSDSTDIEDEKALVLGTKAVTNMTLSVRPGAYEAARQASVAQSAANDPALQALKALLGI